MFFVDPVTPTTLIGVCYDLEFELEAFALAAKLRHLGYTVESFGGYGPHPKHRRKQFDAIERENPWLIAGLSDRGWTLHKNIGRNAISCTADEIISFVSCVNEKDTRTPKAIAAWAKRTPPRNYFPVNALQLALDNTALQA